MKRILTLLASLSLVAGFFAATPAPAMAQPGWVDVAHDGTLGGGSCKTPNYHSIQDAIDDGAHYIYICNGLYKEHITNIGNGGDNQPIHLWGENQLKTILDGTGNGRVYDSTAGIYLERLTIRNGSATEEGGGVLTYENASCSYVTFDNNTSGNFGGAVQADGTFTADHCTFMNNSAVDGGAVAAGSITDSYGKYTGNSAERTGGAIASGQFNISNSTFTNNWLNNADGEGGAVSAVGGPNYVANSVFRSNQAGDGVTGDGGAIVVNGSGDTTIAGSSFVSNTAGGFGGALAVQDLYLAAAGRRVNIFQGNHAANGGAIAANDVEITGGQFTGNVADESAGVLVALSVTVSNASFTANTALSGPGGAILADSNVIARGTTFAKNVSCRFGGAISAAYVGIGRSTFTDNNVDACDGDGIGGAIYAWVGGIVEGSTFARNTAATAAGALFAGEQINISRSTFKDNYAEFAAGAVAVGDGDGAEVTTTTISSSSFIANSAGFTAGAIGISDPAALALRGNLLQGNRVVNLDGASMYFPGTTPYAGTGAVEVLTNAPEGFTAIPLTISGNRFIGNTGVLTGGFSFVSICSTSTQHPSTAMLRSNTWKSNVGIYTQDLLSYALVGTSVSANSDYLALVTEYCGGD